MQTNTESIFSDKSLFEAYVYLFGERYSKKTDAINAIDKFFEHYSNIVLKNIQEIFSRANEDSPREIRLYNNITYSAENYYKERHCELYFKIKFLLGPDEIIDPIYPDGFVSLANLYNASFLPCGNPSELENWMILANVYDENMEPFSTLCSNGFLTIKP